MRERPGGHAKHRHSCHVVAVGRRGDGFTPLSKREQQYTILVRMRLQFVCRNLWDYLAFGSDNGEYQ